MCVRPSRHNFSVPLAVAMALIFLRYWQIGRGATGAWAAAGRSASPKSSYLYFFHIFGIKFYAEFFVAFYCVFVITLLAILARWDSRAHTHTFTVQNVSERSTMTTDKLIATRLLYQSVGRQPVQQRVHRLKRVCSVVSACERRAQTEIIFFMILLR